jgi:Spy/CpxP family protein refolding chaperone
MNEAASQLGKLAKGVKKRLTPEQRKVLSERLARARMKRWKKPTTR